MVNVIKVSVGIFETNSYVVFDDTKTGFIVDPGDDGEKIMDVVKKNGVRVEKIFLTHAHFDHILALEYVQNKTGATALFHKDNIEFLLKTELNLSSVVGVDIKPIKDYKALNDGDKVKVGEMEFDLLHTPGHTDGSSCLVFSGEGKGAIFSGDTIFRENIGRVDFPTGSMEKMKVSLGKLKNLEGDYDIYSGHGPDTTLSHEKCFNPYMRGV